MRQRGERKTKRNRQRGGRWAIERLENTVIEREAWRERGRNLKSGTAKCSKQR